MKECRVFPRLDKSMSLAENSGGSAGAEKRKGQETTEQKRARLRKELEEVEEAEKEKAELAIATAVAVHFSEDSLLQKIASAIKTQLKFGTLEVMENLSSHLYSPLQNCRYGDALKLEFSDARGRQYELAVTASNMESRRENRPELRLLPVHDSASPRKASVKALYSTLLGPNVAPQDFYDYQVRVSPKPGSFDVSMLPFDAATNIAIGQSPSTTRLFDILLLAVLMEAAGAWATAKEALAEENPDLYGQFDCHRLVQLAFENARKYENAGEK